MDNKLSFEKFSKIVSEIDNESKNSIKQKKIETLLDNAGEDIEVASRFVQGNIFPSWKNQKISVGEALTQKVLAKSSKFSEEDIEEKFVELGDLGLVAERINIEDPDQFMLIGNNLSLGFLYNELDDISRLSGSGSQSKKVSRLSSLLKRTDNEESKYFVRLIKGDMRIGVGKGIVRKAISSCFNVSEDLVERGIMLTNDVGEVSKIAKESGKEGLKSLNIEIGRPVEHMLASSGEIGTAVEEASGDIQKVSAEFKYDGARLQIHKRKDDIHLFTRNLIDVSESMPDLIKILQEKINCEECILDSEVLAYDSENNLLSFNELQKRIGRKHNIEEKSNEIHLNVYVFDLLYKNGISYLQNPLSERQEHLRNSCDDDIIVQNKIITEEKEIKNALSEALDKGNEGLVVKNINSTYSPGSRGKDWLKIKPDIDTLDCAVVGGEWGEGSNAKRISSYKLAVLNEDGKLLEIGKVANGFEEEELDRLTERFKDLIISENGDSINFKEEIVFEVGFEEIQESPDYDSGYSLRFPRVLGIRNDKDIKDVNKLDKVEKMYTDK